jgi:glycosyltransferase involved in cell wall biosynthesis
MKIAVVYLGHKGAGPIFTLSLSKSLSEFADVKCFLSKNITNHNEWIEQDLKAVFFEIPHSFKRFFSSVTLKSINKILEELDNFKPDVVIFTMIHPLNFVLQRSLKKRNYKILSFVHDPVPHEGEKLWVRLIQKWELKYPDFFFTLSNFSKHQLSKLTKKPIGYYLHPVMSDTSPPEIPSEVNLEILRNKFVFLYVGRIEPYKGLEKLVDAFLNLSKDNDYKDRIYLIIAGAGDLSKTTRDKLRKLQNSHSACFINRFLKDAEITGLIKLSHMVVLPYLSATQSGILSTVYYHKKPAIVTSVGGLIEQSFYGTGSLIVTPDSDSLRESMKFILSNEKIYSLLLEEIDKIYYKLPTWSTLAKKLIEFIIQNIKSVNE